MAKKETVQRFVPPVEEPKPVPEEQPFFESEAYGSPQPDKGMDTTVTKPVGIGGPVPIVAPKHNTIQLQPIIVPLAVVPYMTQDSDVLRTDGSAAGSSLQGAYGSGEAASFEKVDGSRSKDKSKDKSAKAGSGSGKARAFSFFVFLFSAVAVVCYLLAKYARNLLGLDFAGFNVIDRVADWIRTGVCPMDKLTLIMYSVSAGMSAISVLVTLVTLIAGKYPRALMTVLTLLSTAPVIVVLILEAIGGGFVLKDQIALLILAGATFISFLLSVIFAVAGVKPKEKEIDERRANFDTGSEI